MPYKMQISAFYFADIKSKQLQRFVREEIFDQLQTSESSMDESEIKCQRVRVQLMNGAVKTDTEGSESTRCNFSLPDISMYKKTCVYRPR
jgi:hypothetical protein